MIPLLEFSWSINPKWSKTSFSDFSGVVWIGPLKELFVYKVSSREQRMIKERDVKINSAYCSALLAT